MELFGDWIKPEWMLSIFADIRYFSQHTFIFLTKCPQNLPKWTFLENCWVGVTATNPQMYHEAIVHLARIKATVKFISIEPMLSQFWVGEISPYVNWLIIGAQTKPYKPPKIEWVQEIVQAADKADVPVFLKNNLLGDARLDLITADMDWAFEQGECNWERLRQEFPK